MKPGHTLVRVRSHRARHKLEQRLGYLPQGYYRSLSARHLTNGEWRAVPDADLDKIRGITGVTIARVIDPGTLRPYFT